MSLSYLWKPTAYSSLAGRGCDNTLVNILYRDGTYPVVLVRLNNAHGSHGLSLGVVYFVCLFGARIRKIGRLMQTN